MPFDTINIGSLVGLVQNVIEFREPQPEVGQEQERAPEGWTPDVSANAVVDEISRCELPGLRYTDLESFWTAEITDDIL